MNFTKIVTMAAVAALMIGCDNAPNSPEQGSVDQELQMIGSDEISGITFENMDKTVHPGDDFFEYVNGTWLKNTDIPADKSRFGSFNVLRDNAEADVRTIIEEASSSGASVGSSEQKVGDLYKSYMDMETRNALGISSLAPRMAQIDAISDLKSMSEYIAEAGKYGLSTPIPLFVSNF